MNKVRVLVVEDSFTIRKRLCEVIEASPDLEVVGEAEDGKRAIELCTALRPDVISLDMMLPVMSGLAATESIMGHVPTPILVVSASTNRAELFKTYDALAAGAVDVLEKPRGDEPDGVWEQKYISTLKLVAKIKVITHPRARLGALGRNITPARVVSAPPSERGTTRVLAIGASTGGPGAIVEVIRGIKTSPIPILVVLHIDEPFSAAFADWLDAQTNHRVAYARDGQPLNEVGGRVLMAPPGRHLMLVGGRVRLGTEPPRHSCKPSVDVLFESIAADCGASALACLLTGMGKDGAAGLLAIRRAGGMTIAQDEATSVVYGMPREAALIGAAERILPLGRIGPVVSAVLELEGRAP